MIEKLIRRLLNREQPHDADPLHPIGTKPAVAPNLCIWPRRAVDYTTLRRVTKGERHADPKLLHGTFQHHPTAPPTAPTTPPEPPRAA